MEDSYQEENEGLNNGTGKERGAVAMRGGGGGREGLEGREDGRGGQEGKGGTVRNVIIRDKAHHIYGPKPKCYL